MNARSFLYIKGSLFVYFFLTVCLSMFTKYSDMEFKDKALITEHNGNYTKNDSTIMIEKIEIKNSIKIMGKEFLGPYEKSSECLDEVKKVMNKNEISYNEFEAVSIYYSDPSKTSIKKLRAFHGFSIQGDFPSTEILDKLQFPSGDYIKASTFDPESLWSLFERGHAYMSKNNIRAKKDIPPVAITTVMNKRPYFSVYFYYDK